MKTEANDVGFHAFTCEELERVSHCVGGGSTNTTAYGNQTIADSPAEDAAATSMLANVFRYGTKALMGAAILSALWGLTKASCRVIAGNWRNRYTADDSSYAFFDTIYKKMGESATTLEMSISAAVNDAKIAKPDPPGELA